ncbi:MAG: sorbosone dehydrogenase family protein [Candidatus Korobacteraceae bacterium]
MKRKLTIFLQVSGSAFLAGVILLANVPAARAQSQYPSAPQLKKDGTAVLLEDYASLPLSSPTHAGAPKTIDTKAQLGRVTSLVTEPGDAPLSNSRFFVVDQSHTIYILDKATRKFSPALNFAEMFPKFVSDTGAHTVGLTALAFDPGYAKNGKFYTVHVEKPAMEGSGLPVSGQNSGLDFSKYERTAPVTPPAGVTDLESVVVEWTDRNVRNASFEGTARELLRISYNRSHPTGDILFNPLARPGDVDFGNLYIAVGDGATGETPGPTQTLPQRLDTLLGKILRITPDLSLRPKDMLSANGRYRIPSTGADTNPFVSVKGARPEIFAYGMRNPHRIFFDTTSKQVLFNDIGFHNWEEVNVLRKGGHYGYAEREGHEQFFPADGKSGSQYSPAVPFPERDVLTVQGLDEVVPLYPAALYSHQDGDAIGDGFVYRGKLLPQLQGKYVFTDLTTGRLLYADLAEILATNGRRNQVAQIHELQVMYKSPESTTPEKRRMFDIVAAAWAKKGGKSPIGHALAGASRATTGFSDAERKQPKMDPEGVPYGGGRADVRIAMDAEGELYVLSKTDGMIRRMVSSSGPAPSSSGAPAASRAGR